MILVRGQISGELGMIRSFLVAAAILAMLMGLALAQTTTSSTTLTQSTTSGPALVIDASSDNSTQRTSDRDGVITDKAQTNTSAATASPLESTASTPKATEAATVR
jgi:cytoskeletal protein RodZ